MKKYPSIGAAKKKTVAARLAFFEKWGKSVGKPIRYPGPFPGGLNRSREITLRTFQNKAKRTMVASFGLANPSGPRKDCAMEQGAQLEFFAIASEPFPWLYQLVKHMVEFDCVKGNTWIKLMKFGTMTVSMASVDVPPEWRAADGTAGLLIGLVDPTSLPAMISLPIQEVYAANVKLLHPQELDYILAGASLQRGTNLVIKKLLAQGNAHVSSLSRAPVV